MESVLEKISPQQRLAFSLRFFEEMTLEEIAGAMQVEVGTVKAHLFRAVSAVEESAEGAEAEMNGHLSDEQWAAAVLNENDETAAKHLAECATCREEVSAFAAAADAARAQARKVMEQPETFWRRQREGINARLADREFTHPWKRWIWVTATVTLILLASTLLFRNSAPPIQTAAQTDSDDALLLSVQQSIQSDLPQALRPATLLTQEMGRAEAARRNP